MASAFMYLRLTILIGIFSLDLLRMLAVPFLLLATAAALTGWLWSRRPDGPVERLHRQFQHGNPLELRTAFAFAGLFLIVLVVTRLVLSSIGNKGAYILAAIIGLADVDPFIMSMTRAVGSPAQLSLSAGAILVAVASNNLAKGIYAFSFGSRSAGLQSLSFLLALALLGLLPILWI